MKKAPPTKKEETGKFYEKMKGLFKVGDKVKHFVYGEGVITKINKMSMEMKVPPQYDRDTGIRKIEITTDERRLEKI
jgi:RNA polymerase-interacting CarD/CdnL/TRCF family regulator